MDPHGEDLPPPPPIPSDVQLVQAESDKGSPSRSPPMKGQAQPNKPKRIPAARPALATRGQKINLLSNHYRVNVKGTADYFYHYSVLLKYEDDRAVDGKGIGRKVIDKMKQTYDSELGNKDFAYDGEKTLFTLGPLPQNKNEFVVVLEDLPSGRTGKGSPGGNPGEDSPGGSDRKRLRKPYNTKTFKVEVNFATKIPMSAIAQSMKGHESENSQEAFRVLDIILRQHSASQGCLLVRQSFFHNNPNNFIDLGGGVMGCRGFHSSFRTTQSGLSLNIDVSTTMIVKPGPVIDFLVVNQNVNHPSQIDWQKAKRMLKNLRIRVLPSNQEYKIVGLSDLPCGEQTFMLKQRNGEGEREVTVSQYYKEKGTDLRYSDHCPCINVGKPRRPTFYPIELCHLVSLQRYTKALNSLQRASLVEKSRQKPQERMQILNDALRRSNYDSEPMLRACGISISPSFTPVDGRVLQAPKLKTGNGGDFSPRDGRWNFNNKTLIRPCHVDKWAVVNFSARCDVRSLIRDLIRCGNMKGVKIDDPFNVFEEGRNMRGTPPNVRVDEMFEQVRTKLPGAPRFLLCLLPERKNSDIYGPWKRKCLADFGIVTQCLAPSKVNDQYLTNLLLKINAKLGGMNSLLQVEDVPSIPLISRVPTIILGMDVSHGSPGQADRPSIAAVVSSRQWPLISKYRASVHAQSAKLEMIDSLFKPKVTADGPVDEGIIKELLVDFYSSSGKRKPDHVIIFRDGVSESQFSQVLNNELDQIMAACKFLDENWNPKFTVIVAQKNHHTKFFIQNDPNNVPPGTVIDNKVCHPRNYDFYMCSHKGAIGTTRPTHYHVLLDQIGFTPDDLQELVHSLSYVYQRSTTAISVVAPICYAHLAATQVGQFMKFDDYQSDTSSSQGGHSSGGGAPVPELPRLHEKVRSSMFFC
ncbi:Argonaute family protein [Rhynchospora pubera]|uniref:Argonaute family protein n=1 Tax=Rhynchospora pubera TaxID=906938 RepID=A0AAV8F979_9POAL|nr:Argonaute family protein [Rhynchospora pubera]